MLLLLVVFVATTLSMERLRPQKLVNFECLSRCEKKNPAYRKCIAEAVPEIMEYCEGALLDVPSADICISCKAKKEQKRCSIPEIKEGCDNYYACRSMHENSLVRTCRPKHCRACYHKEVEAKDVEYDRRISAEDERPFVNKFVSKAAYEVYQRKHYPEKY
jgi:hypothetical protein